MSGSTSEFTFENVWEQVTPELSEEAVAFWVAHRALPAREGSRRTAELVFVARDSGGRLVAVSTAVRRLNEEIGHHFYYYRTFVAPEWRRSHIAVELTLRVREFFNETFDPSDPGSAIGLFAVVENRALKEVRNEAVWARTGFVFIGRTREGHHKRVCYFEGARISP